jgi:hypothetical protein
MRPTARWCCSAGSPVGPAYDDTWTWDGTDWTKRYLTYAPPARYGVAMAFDAIRGDVALFGGLGHAYLGGTWTWNGRNWTQRQPALASPTRVWAGMVDDVANGQLALFGGLGATGHYLDDTWTWDGIDWTQRTPPHAPLPRAETGMAYDAAHVQVVLFGGTDEIEEPWVGDTWTWDAQIGEFPVARRSRGTRHRACQARRCWSRDGASGERAHHTAVHRSGQRHDEAGRPAAGGCHRRVHRAGVDPRQRDPGSVEDQGDCGRERAARGPTVQSDRTERWPVLNGADR